MSAIAYGRLEWQEEQLLGLVWLLERQGWSVSFRRKAGSSAITAALEQAGTEYSGTCESQPGQLFSSWGALQEAVAKLPAKPVTAKEFNQLVCANADLQSQRASAWEALEQVRGENIRWETEVFESRQLIGTLVQKLGGKTTVTYCELAEKKVSLVREEIVGGFRFTVQERPSAPKGGGLTW
jgi:hypothetical protein